MSSRLPGPPQRPDPASLNDLMPFTRTIGVTFSRYTASEVRARLEWSESLCTAAGLMHGGAVMALADSTGAACAFMNLPANAKGTTTIESKTNFLRGVRDGAVTATSRVLHKGRTTIVIETEIAREDDGALVAKVTQTQAFHYPREG